MTWVIVVFNVLMLIWVVGGGASAGSSCGDLTNEFEQAGCGAGTAIGIGILMTLWVFGDVILGVLWLVTRPRGVRTCPVCGNDVKKGLVVCKKCGYDFRTAAQGARS
jgi:uncharacterized protein (UPF0212 family)